MNWRSGDGGSCGIRLWSAPGNVRDAACCVISTAGWDQTSWPGRSGRSPSGKPTGILSSRGPCASWISDAWREQQAAHAADACLRAAASERMGRQASGAFLTAAEVDAIFTDTLPSGPGEVAYGLDLGLAKDRSVLSRVRHDARTSLVVIEGLETWTPRPGARVDLMEVEETVAGIVRERPAPVYLDPWQGVLLGQRLRGRGLEVREVSFTGESPPEVVRVDPRSGPWRSAPLPAARRLPPGAAVVGGQRDQLRLESRSQGRRP